MAPLTGRRGVGLDIGGTKTHGVVLGEDGSILAQVRESTRPGAEGVVATAERVFEALAHASGGSLECHVGVGVPGLVDSERGMLRHAVNLGVNGDDLPLRDLLTGRLGVPVVVENDVNAAALGTAAALGLGRAGVGYLSIGTGVGAGRVIDGKLHRGSRAAALTSFSTATRTPSRSRSRAASGSASSTSSSTATTGGRRSSRSCTTRSLCSRAWSASASSSVDLPIPGSPCSATKAAGRRSFTASLIALSSSTRPTICRH